ncbi:MAG: ATP-binding protein [Minwuia sp.]|uniref:ATP-binding protein n=1 Tax=Minwuia sp. TaxID=2493630 RepID=UPI003A8B5C99
MMRLAVAAGVFLAVGLGMATLMAALVLDDLRTRTTLESARSYSSMLTVFRDYYTKVVVGAANRNGVPISTDYHRVEGAVPPPATMTIEMGLWMSDLIRPGSFRFYSDYPFRGRENGGPQSDFEAEALRILGDGTKESYFRVDPDQGAGAPVLRFAKPIAMGAGCVACHNSHPDSPRHDWKIGDVRGVQVVSLGMPPLVPSLDEYLDRDLRTLAPMMGLGGGILLIALLLLLLMRRLRRALDLADRRNTALAAAQVQAEQAADAKSRIMANVSHELRTPMNAIMGFSELMSAEALGPFQNPKYREYAGNVHGSAQRLMAIIDNMITLADLDDGNVRLQREAVDVLGEIRRAAAMVRPDADAAGILLEIDRDAPWPVLVMDRRSLRQILGNLIGNAAKHAGSGVRVVMSASIDRESVRISVTDDGVGIADADIHRIMQPFESVADPAFANADGIGVGLAVARQLAAIHSGEVSIRPRPGGGLIATLILPATCLAGVPQEHSDAARTAMA